MNGLHKNNSKLNIRSYPKVKKTDSDLLQRCPRALCSGLSTFESLQCINHLHLMALSRSRVHMDIFQVSLYMHICDSYNHPQSISNNVLEKEISPTNLFHGNDIGLRLSLCAHSRAPLLGEKVTGG